MHALIAAALQEAAPMFESRGWKHPTTATMAEATRLLELTSQHRAPLVQVDADGAIRLEWEAADAGWLALMVDGSGRITHRAVLGDDEFEQSEDFGSTLPKWAEGLLTRLARVGH